MTIEVFRHPEDYKLEADDDGEQTPGWYYWYCQPGCLPDSEFIGPFESADQAKRDAEESEDDAGLES